MDADWTNALDRAREHAPFLARALDRRPDLAELLAAGRAEEALYAAKQAGGETVASALRRERLGLALVLAIGDLAGEFALDKVMRELSTFADRALHSAICAAVARRVPEREPARPDRAGAGQARRGRTQLFLRHRSDPALRSPGSATPPPRRARRSRAALRPRYRPPAVGGHQRGLRLPGRPPAASRFRSQPAGDLARCGDGALRDFRTGLGAGGFHPRARLCRRHRPRRDLSRSHPAVRLAPQPRFRGDRRNAPSDPAHSRSPDRPPRIRAGVQPQARSRGHPRDRILRPDAPADPWRTRPQPARSRNPRGARCAGRDGADTARRRASARRKLRRLADDRAPTADGRRPADAHAAHGRGAR